MASLACHSVVSAPAVIVALPLRALLDLRSPVSHCRMHASVQVQAMANGAMLLVHEDPHRLEVG